MGNNSAPINYSIFKLLRVHRYLYFYLKTKTNLLTDGLVNSDRRIKIKELSRYCNWISVFQMST